MRFTRRRSERPEQVRYRLGSSLETLEGRPLLSSTVHPFAPWQPHDLPVDSAPNNQPLPFTINGLVAEARINPQAPFVNNQGKIVSGQDRQGNTWTITVHGPGTVLVTDTTPNDGVLDDTIDTIQLIGTNPNTTYVTGNVETSERTPTDGTVLFNRLIDASGVKSVILNGFTLTQTVTPPNGGLNNTDTGVFLLGGVGLLQFHDIIAAINQATDDQPINIIIGDPSTPLTTEPTIRLDEIWNTVFNTNATAVPTSPQTSATVNIEVNGVIKGLDIISSTQHPVVDPTQTQRTTTVRDGNPTLSPIIGAGEQFQFPIVGTTGRTAVRATAIDHLNVRGSAINVTASRGTTPFQNGLSGLSRLGEATFGGNADAVGLDVNGPINKLRFRKGLGSPVGATQAATSYGIPSGRTGYPAAGLEGGLVTATKIGHVTAKPANVVTQTPMNPEFILNHGTLNPNVFTRSGNALTSATIVSAGSIGSTSVKGNLVNSEIKSGFDYPSYAAGLEGTRAPSKIGPLRVHGDLVNGVVSATDRPVHSTYNIEGGTVKGPGTIKGTSSSVLYVTGARTPLGNAGAGYFAKHKKGGYLPPPTKSNRIDGVLFR